MMRKFTVAAVMFAGILPAAAQGPAPAAQPPPFEPVTITEADFKQLQTWLGEQPAKFAIPMLQFFEALERRTLEAKAKAEAEAKAKDKPAN